MAKTIGEGTRPLICAPLVGVSREAIVDELRQILDKRPDVIEWRADFFAQIANTQAVIAVLSQIKQIAKDMPVIFTIRSSREGGQAIPLSDCEAIELNAEICRQTAAEYIDCELSYDPQHIQYLRQVAAEHGKKLIGSFHNFACTPSREELAEKFSQAEQYRMDIAKVAVMPQNLEDVLTLLGATLDAKKRYTMPLITISMGRYGAISRMVGGAFGSALTFAVGANASAPGQVPIEDLRTVIETVDKYLK